MAALEKKKKKNYIKLKLCGIKHSTERLAFKKINTSK